jgi:hypothetical protein
MHSQNILIHTTERRYDLRLRCDAFTSIIGKFPMLHPMLVCTVYLRNDSLLGLQWIIDGCRAFQRVCKVI